MGIGVAVLCIGGAVPSQVSAADTAPWSETGIVQYEAVNLVGTASFDLGRRSSAASFPAPENGQRNVALHHDPSIDAAGMDPEQFDRREVLGPSWSYQPSEGAP